MPTVLSSDERKSGAVATAAVSAVLEVVVEGVVDLDLTLALEAHVVKSNVVLLKVLVDDVGNKFPAFRTKGVHHLRKSSDLKSTNEPAFLALTVNVENVELLSNAATKEVKANVFVFPRKSSCRLLMSVQFSKFLLSADDFELSAKFLEFSVGVSHGCLS